MLSRRNFLFASVGLGLSLENFVSAVAKTKKHIVKSPIIGNLSTISRQDWPPAILPDQTSFIDKGLSCFTDEFGHLVIADLRSTKPKILSELSVPCKKIIDFATASRRGYALVLQQSATGDPSYKLVTINLSNPNSSSVISSLELNGFSEPTCIAVSSEIICIGGTSSQGSPVISIYSTSPKRDFKSLSSINVELPIMSMNLTGKRLTVLGSGRASQVDFIDLHSLSTPQIENSVQINGDFQVMCSMNNYVLVCGSENEKYEARLIYTEPAPHAVQSFSLGEVSAIYDAKAQYDYFMLLAERNNKQVVLYLNVKNKELQIEQALELPASKEVPGLRSALALSGKVANVVSGRSEVKVLSQETSGWQQSYVYVIPRLPATSVAAWNNHAVLCGVNLTLYDITQAEKPIAVSTINADGPIKSVAVANSNLLCLGNQTLSLRKLDKLDDVVSTLKVAGQQLAYDTKTQYGYVLDKQENKASITPVNIASNSLVAESSFDIDSGIEHISVDNGQLAASNDNSIFLYSLATQAQLIGSYHFETQVIRDIVLTDQYIVATAIDQSSRGFILVLSKESSGTTHSLSLIGSIDLPQDGMTIAVSGNRALVIGRTSDGKDMISEIDLSTPAIPRLIASVPVIEAASAISIKDNLAIVVGRGIEILNLS